MSSVTIHDAGYELSCLVKKCHLPQTESSVGETSFCLSNSLTMRNYVCRQWALMSKLFRAKCSSAILAQKNLRLTCRVSYVAHKHWSILREYSSCQFFLRLSGTCFQHLLLCVALRPLWWQVFQKLGRPN